MNGHNCISIVLRVFWRDVILTVLTPSCRRKGWYKGLCLWGARAGVRSVPKAPLKNFVKNCQSYVREGKYFQIHSLVPPIYLKLLTMVLLGNSVCLPCTKISLWRAHFSHIQNACEGEDSRVTFLVTSDLVSDLSEDLIVVRYACCLGFTVLWKIKWTSNSTFDKEKFDRSETMLTENNTTMLKCHWLVTLENTW